MCDNQGRLPLSKPLFSWVLENLIRNAVDAMDGEGVLVLRSRWDEGAYMLDVEDNGEDDESRGQEGV